ncbi:MAG: serine hydrolase [Minisyncoccia bacterium]
MKHRYKYIVLILIIAIFIIVAFIYTSDKCVNKNFFINPYLKCQTDDVVAKGEYRNFKVKLQEYIDQKTRNGELDDIGIWFRDLEFGPTFGINERKDFVPASLLKLPLALTYYDLASTNRDLLDERLIFPSNLPPVPVQTFKPIERPELGKSYTISELIRFMLVYSDNVSAQMLYDNLLQNYQDAQPLKETYRDMGIIDVSHNFDEVSVNTKGYGSIFRLLHNISFLNVGDSNTVLELLSESDFKLGLVAGVPPEIKVAHKFGERVLEGNAGKELHDCGIIYYPQNAYALCVMTKGNDFKQLSKIIADISKMVYQEFDSRKLN